MPHALAADAGDGDFDSATIADHILILDAFVFSARALVVTNGPEDFLAEQTARLGFKRAIVNRLGILHLALGPFTDGLGRSDGDGHAVERALFEAQSGAGFITVGGGGFGGLNHGFSS